MSASPAYPLLLDVSGRRAVVVGGGPVAARRASELVAAGAHVTVVAPQMCEVLADLRSAGALEWRSAEYAGRADLDGAWIVHTASGDSHVDAQVAADAEQSRIWCVRADLASASAAWTPAVARSGDVIVAVNAGGDPGRAVAVRNAVSSLLDTGRLPVRRRRPVGTPGRVFLVGAGPGDPGLITSRGRRLLAEADVVVVDRLVAGELVDGLDEDVQIVDVGKTPGHHPVPQDAINELLVEHARQGRRVVRLKGGDPYVLGRGGEEAAACRAAGVPVEVVPGVSSATSVPAAAGIPVTHRGIAKQFTVASGHDGLDWPSLAKVEGTLVLLMGMTRLADSACRLVEHGKDPGTPVAIIEDGYGRGERVTVGTLATIGELARERAVRPPAVIVVGEVVRLATPRTPSTDGPGA